MKYCCVFICMYNEDGGDIVGICITVLGFLFLHFHYFNYVLSTIELFPYSVSLFMIILGLLYIYRYTKRKEYIYVSIISIIMMIMLFFDNYNIRSVFLTLQTLMFVIFTLLIRKESPIINKNKALLVWLGIYTISSIVRAWSIYGWQFLNRYNDIAIIISFVSVIVLNLYIMKTRNQFYFEKQPQTTSHNVTSYQYVLMIIMSVGLIIGIYQPFVKYATYNNVDIKYYQLANEKIELGYYLQYNINYSKTTMGVNDFIPTIKLLSDDNIKKISLFINEELVLSGDYQDNLFVQTYKKTHALDNNDRCIIKLDDTEYPLEVKKVNPKKYGYKGDGISISNAVIENNHMILLPRVALYFQNHSINHVQILDKTNVVIADSNNLKSYIPYQDIHTLYYEIPYTISSPAGEGPYIIRIIYNAHPTTPYYEEYPLTIYEIDMP